MVLDRRCFELMIDGFCRVCCVSRRYMLIDIDVPGRSLGREKKLARKQKEAAKKTESERAATRNRTSDDVCGDDDY